MLPLLQMIETTVEQAATESDPIIVDANPWSHQSFSASSRVKSCIEVWIQEPGV